MNLKIGQTVNLDYPLIHWFQLENSRNAESFGNPLIDLDAQYERDNRGKVVVITTPPKGVDSATWSRGLVQRLIDGWDISQGATKVEPITKEQIAKAVKDRQRQIDLWQHAKMFDLVETAKKVWFPNGKAVEPVAVANETFRRAYATMGAIHRRLKETGKTEFIIPAMVVSYSDEVERRIDHLSENLRKDGGRSLLTDADLLGETAKLLKLGSIEADLIRAGISKGTAQRLMRTYELSQKYKDVHKGLTIVERCLLPAPAQKEGKYPYVKDGFLNSKALGKEKLQFLIHEKNPAQAEQGAGIKMENADPYPFTVANVEKFLESTLQGGVNAQKQMASTRIAQYAKVCESKLVKYVMSAIVAGDEKGQKMLAKLLANDKLVAKIDKLFQDEVSKS